MEQFTMLLEAASAAGDGAFWLAVLYIGKGYVGSILTTGGLLAALWMVPRVISNAIAHFDGLQGFANEARRAAGFSRYDAQGRVSEDERARVSRLIKLGVEADADR